MIFTREEKIDRSGKLVYVLTWKREELSAMGDGTVRRLGRVL